VRTDTVADLLQQVQGRHVVQFSVAHNATELCKAMAGAFPQLYCQAVTGGTIRVESTEPVRVGELVRFLEDRGAEVTEARKVQPSLEEVFVQVTGIEAAAMKREKEKAGAGV
jgi:ABC-2 type transport system ATP-binding protein